MNEYRVSVIAGDGIGPEVMPEAVATLDLVAQRYAFRFDWTEYGWGSAHYLEHGRMMPVDGIEQLRASDAILLGAVGHPQVDDVTTLWGLLIPIRRSFDQYVNVRPAVSIPGVASNVLLAGPVDMVVIRENVEGEYSTVGGVVYEGQEHEAAIQDSVFTRRGVQRVARYAAELAAARQGRLVSATKSNGIIHTMPFWDRVVAETVADFPDVRLESVLVDALCARFVSGLDGFDVVVASNLFGDILSDLAAGIAGSLGVAPSANLNPERVYPSMFEPVHGSAPDIAGAGVANPTAQILSAAMMLDHLGELDAAGAVRAAVYAALSGGTRTADLGGTAGTAEFGAAVRARLTSQ